MFSLTVQMQVRPGRRAEFLEGMSANAEASVRDEPGCLRIDVCSDAAGEHRFVLYELYAEACFRNRGEGSMALYWIYGGRDVSRTLTATGETFEHLSESDRGAVPARPDDGGVPAPGNPA